jgi:voltage-gated potassium channel
VAVGTDRGRVDLAVWLRTAVLVALLLVVYYQAPLDRPLTLGTGLLFVVGLVLVALVVVIEVRGILASRRPRLRAIRLIALALPLLLVVFAAMYSTVQEQQAGAFTQSMTRTDALYFTLTTFATVGFGDIAPKTELARVMVMFQMLVGLLVVGVIAKVVLGAVRVAQERNTDATDVEASHDV